MYQRFILPLLLVSIVATEVSGQNRTHRRRGAILGGLAGAAIGIAIGDKGNNETAGGLIGGAVGAIAGGAIGDARDRRIEHQQRYHSGYSSAPTLAAPPQVYAPPTTYSGDGVRQLSGYEYVPPPEPQPAAVPYDQGHVFDSPGADGLSSAVDSSGAVSHDDVITMVRAELPSSLIIDQIRLRGVREPLTIADVIRLHQQGVDEPILKAMQQTALRTSVTPPIDNHASGNAGPTSDPYGPSVLSPANQR